MKKVNYKKVKTLSLADQAYIAGIIDGEGTITLTVKQKGGTPHLAVTVSNTELPLLNYLHKAIGAGKITNKRTYKSHHTPSYTYALFNRQALALLEQVAVYLRTYKSLRARLVLDKYIILTVRNGRYTEVQLNKRRKFVEKFLAIIPKNRKALLHKE